ncbi:hypothetical protein ACIBF5_09650 [Micromonospora sp. NPDC050417]|uniref:hypothetical protein n=1 Tax=Micromonospora sp. NPDC050417 TaxID=3364280 RepID=UPI00378D3E31
MRDITLSDLELVDGIERLAAAATEGPWAHDPDTVWRFHSDGRPHVAVLAIVNGQTVPIALTGFADAPNPTMAMADAAFIRAARTAVPHLVDLVRRLLDERTRSGAGRRDGAR